MVGLSDTKKSFSENSTLHRIASDNITGDASVNYYRTQEMDEKIQTDMLWKTVAQYSLKKEISDMSPHQQQ